MNGGTEVRVRQAFERATRQMTHLLVRVVGFAQRAAGRAAAAGEALWRVSAF